jgi:VanZ family protein
MATSRALTLWLPVVLWASLIFALSSVPSLSSGLGGWDYVLRKCAHVTEYAVLGFLLARAIGREAPAFVAGVLYAASDELHQSFVRGRHASPIDVAIDSVGLLIGLAVWRRGFGQVRGGRVRGQSPVRSRTDG